MAAADILHVQCGGSARRARATIDELTSKKLPGRTLHERWLLLIAWYGQGRPRVFRKPTRTERAEIRAMIARNAELASRLAS